MDLPSLACENKMSVEKEKDLRQMLPFPKEENKEFLEQLIKQIINLICTLNLLLNVKPNIKKMY